MWRKSTRRLYERETKDKKQTERPRTTSNRLKTRAQSTLTRVVSSLLETTQRTHTSFGPFFVVVPRGRKKRKDHSKTYKKGPKNTPKKKKREEKRYDTGEREREREREREGAAAPKNTHDFENDSKEKELRFFKKKKKKKKLTIVCCRRCAILHVLFLLFPTTTTGRNKSPPLVPPRSCSSTPPRRTLKSWVSRCKTASRMPRRKSLSNRSFRTADRLSTSRRTAPGTLRRKKVESRRTWRDRTLGARRLPVNRASTLCLASKFVYYA